MNLDDIPNPRAGKFAPKLSFGDRVAAFTAHHWKRRSIAECARAFGITQPVMGKLCSTSNKQSYKRLREEVNRLGLEQAYDTYFTAGHSELFRQSAEDEAAKKDIPSKALTEPNKAANHKQGTHYTRKGNEFKVDLLEIDGILGWWVGFNYANGFGWTGDDEGNPFLTSNAAYAHGMRTLD